MKQRQLKNLLCGIILCLCAGSTLSAVAQTASFTIDNPSGCGSAAVNATNTSTAGATAYDWYFGEGTGHSSLANASHLYTVPGTYTITLTATYPGGTKTATQTVHVYKLPTAAFTPSVTNGCAPLKVDFVNKSVAGDGTITTALWDYGDKFTSDQSTNTSHTYVLDPSDPGNHPNGATYPVSLVIVNSFGCKSAPFTGTSTIHVNVAPLITVGSDITGGCSVPLVVNFKNTEVEDPGTTYSWDYGDGTSGASAQHTYTKQGDFNVVATATSASGCTTVSLPYPIAIHPIKADFSVSNTCTNVSVNFTNTSSPLTPDAKWDFGDGGAGTGNSAGHTFITAGSFQVTMTALAGPGCSSTPVTKTVDITNPPVIANTLSALGSCTAPFSHTFTASATGATQYKWDFGDGSTATTATATHTYTAEGDYKVTLTVSNSGGCSVSKLVNNVSIHSPQANMPGRGGCLPYPATFNPVITSTDPVVSMNWDFGDGSTGTGLNPSHVYTTQGDFNVKLTMTTAGGCIKDTVFTNSIVTGAKLTVDFTATPVASCAQQPIIFNNLTGPAPLSDSIKWNWSFGAMEGNSTNKVDSHSYQTSGKQTVILTADNNGCVSMLVKPDYIVISQPIARMATSMDCTQPLVRQATDRSDTDPANPGKVYQYTWDFGDGTPIITSKNPPPHTYATPGAYMIHHSISDGGCTTYDSSKVNVVDQHPVLSVNKNPVCMNSDVTFTLSGYDSASIKVAGINFTTSTGTITDSITLTKTPFTYIKHFSDPQDITVSVGFKDASELSCIHTTNQIVVTVNGAVPKIIMTSANCVGNAVTFSDNSITNASNTITAWRFDWGDGSPSTGKLTTKPVNVAHTFQGTNQGFNVTYSIYDNSGCGPYGATIFVPLRQPVADFASASPYACLNTPIAITNNSSPGVYGGTLTTYNWDFGDNTTATDMQPNKAYTKAGAYDITLKVADELGCTATKTIPKIITVQDPKAVFSLPDISQICPPVIANFTNTSTDYTSVAWDFGDGANTVVNTPTHVFNRPGTYTIQLTVTSLGACTSVASQTVQIKGPNGELKMSSLLGCAPLATTATAINTVSTAQFVWDYDDGSPLDNTTTPTDLHTYTRPGVYTPRLLLVDGDGCKVPATGTNQVVVDSIGASFVVDATKACDGGIVYFTGTAQSVSQQVLGLPSTFTWDFGTTDPNNTATGDSPSHTYTLGDYTVTMNATSAGGCVAPPVKNPVHISPLPQPVIDPITPICVGGNLLPVGHDTKNVANTTWLWQTNGNKYPYQVPPHIAFPQSGSFPITLTISNADGTCPNTATANVTVNALPIANVTPKQGTVCEGSSLQLTATANPGDQATWTNYNISDNHSFTPSVTPDEDTVYRVQIQDAIGCTSYDSAIITVTRRFSIITNPAVAICAGKTTELSASGADLYSWSPAAGLNKSNVANPLATPATSTVYEVTGTDKAGCFTEKAQVNVTVNPAPTLKVASEQSIPVGSELPIQVTGSNDIVNVVWYPVDGLSCTTCLNPVIQPKHDVSYTITATNIYGCTDMQQVNIKLLCETGVAFLPNTFTPNGDGMNDIFYLRGKGVRVVKTFKIFNRLGQLVFQRDNFQVEDPTFGWDGRVKGVAVAPDVFVYYAELVCDNDQPFEMKGTIMLLR